MRLLLLVLVALLLIPLPAPQASADPRAPVAVVEAPEDQGPAFPTGIRRVAELPRPYLEEEYFVSGEVEVFEYEEGGLNDYVHKLPGRVKYSDLTLKRGMATSDELWEWYARALGGEIERKNVSVTLYDVAGEEYRRWNFEEAYPTKWTAPDFRAGENAVAIETLVLAHRGLQLT